MAPERRRNTADHLPPDRRGDRPHRPSLSYLPRLPVKKIKIDRSFIDTLGTSEQTSAIVSRIVGLGQSLHVTITAEGVETERPAEILRKWGCDQVQGFYYGRPDPEVPESEEAIASQPRVA